MKKKILIAILIIIATLGAAIFYLNAVYLPTKIKSVIISTLEKQLNRKVSLENLRYNLFKGIIINNLIIYESPLLEQKPFLTVREASFNLLYLPVFRKKTIVIPAIKIDSLQINFIRLTDNEWNFNSLLVNRPADSPSPFSFFVYRINLLNAKCYLEDRTRTPSYTQTIPNLNGRAYLTLPKNIKFELQAKLSEQSVGSLFLLRGNYHIGQQLLTASVNLRDIDLLRFQPYYNFPFEVKGAVAKEAGLQILVQKDTFSLTSRIESEQINIEKSPYNFLGKCFINLRIQSSAKKEEAFLFDGSVEISEAQIKGVKFLKDIKAIKGTIKFDRQKISTQELQGISNETAIRLNGTITDFNNPIIEARIFSYPKLEKLDEIFSDFIKDFDFEIKGKAELVLDINGPLNDPGNLTIKGDANISQATLSLPQLPGPLKDINGRIEFDKNAVRWNKLALDYSGTTYISNGSLINFSQPHIELDMGSRLLSLSTKLDIKDKNLSLSQFTGEYLNGQFDFKGEAGLANLNNPLLDLTGAIKLDLKDLTQMLPKFKSSISMLKPSGKINMDVVLRGQLIDWKKWEILANASAPQIGLTGIKLRSLNLSYNQRDEAVKNLSVSANAYEGTVDILAEALLSEPNFPGSINLNISEIDLAKLKMDTTWKEKPTSGKFSLTARIQGPLRNIDGLKGAGSLILKDGNLWELNLLKGLGNLLFIPEFQRIIFKEAGGDFVIRNKAAYTDNLELKSNEMNLSCNGNIDFSGNLNFTINALLNQELVQNSASLRKIVTSIISSASGVLTLKLSGDVQNPKYKIIPATADIINRIREFFTEDILR